MSKGRILIVEDNLDTYKLIQYFLEQKGYDTFLAVNGRDGVDAAIKQKPDMIIMDLAMPEMDGWTATELIKAAPQTSAIPLLALTARVLPADRQRALDSGCDEYIPKPINLNLLIDTIQRMLR